MTRALLEQALDALNTCYVVVDNPDDCGFNRMLVAPAIKALNHALVQPELSPEPSGWRDFIENLATPRSEPLNSVSAYRDNESRRAMMAKIRQAAAELLIAAPPAPDTLTQSTHAADLSKYESEITMLRCDLIDKQAVMQGVITAYHKAKADLADMTAELDTALGSNIKMACEIYDLSEQRKELDDMTAQRDWMAMRFDVLEAGSAADRRDAQRWRFFLTAQDETTPEHAAIVSAANGLFPVSDLSKVMEIAMTGGQP
jgi:hypothetical protein